MLRAILCPLLAATTALGLSACDRSLTRAGVLTVDNIEEVAPKGETAAAKPGDFYLRNKHAVFIIQKPAREVALGPYGGNLVDIAVRTGGITGGDHFGELIPTFSLGRTVYYNEIRLLSDGSHGTDAVVQTSGFDATNVYYNLEGIQPGLIGFLPEDHNIFVLGHDPETPMGLKIRTTYTLPKDEARLTILHQVTNHSDEIRRLPFGLLVDSRAAVEAFAPGMGYAHNLSKSLDVEKLSELLTYDKNVEQQLLVNDQIAISIVPRRITYPGPNGTVEKRPPRMISMVVPVLGAALVLEASSALHAATEPSFSVEPGQSAEIEIDVIAASDAATALAQGWELLGHELATVKGCVVSDHGAPAPAVRVGLQQAELGTIATFTTGDDGCFEGLVPPGGYTAVAGALYRPPSDEVAVTAPGSVNLQLAPLAKLQLQIDIYDALGAAEPSHHPCRVTLIGERQVTSHPAFGDAPIDDPGNAVYRVFHLRTCRETIAVAPNRYLAYVTRGPEFGRIEQLVDLDPHTAAVLKGDLHRVVDSVDYAACDFHVHSVFSPDSAVPAHKRVLSIASEGLDCWASTDHDVVTDFLPFIAELGLADELLTVPGAEVTTFALGHFGAYPLAVNPQMVNGGSPDWAPDLNGRRPPMAELFDAIHQRGAFVQVNHPRGGGVSMGNYFTRAALRYDVNTLQPFADPNAQPVANRYLRYPDALSYFSLDFDIIEVINGISTYVRDGMVYERDVDRAGQDWMNLLTSGRRIVGVANSDTHNLAKPPGNPRTMVAGHQAGTSGVFAALIHGDAVMTTGPMVRLEIHDAEGNRAGLGDTFSPASAAVTLRVHVETPDWYRVNALEVLANAFFAEVPSGNPATLAIPKVSLEPVLTPRVNGGWAWVASQQIELDLDLWPFNGRDGWLLVRVGGTEDILYPLMFSGGGTVNASGDTPETFFSGRWGRHPYAITNPVYLDLDGDGRWH